MATELTQLQVAQMAAILGPDPSHFETLISHLMSSNNDQRSQAETLYNLCKQHQPDSLSLKLAYLLQSSPQSEARAMAAILLRKLLTRDDSFLWPKLDASTQSTLKSVLLSCVQREEVKTISKKVCDTVSELAAGIVPEYGWPELLPFMFQCVTSENMKLRESSLLIFAQLSQFIGETLIPHLDTLHNVFLQCLGSGSNADVRIAALSATVNFIQCLTSNSDRDRFQDLLPPMMQTLTEALNSGQEATAQEALELLIDLAGTEPRFLRRQIVDVVGAMLQIAEAETLEEGTRHLAIEFVITLAEARERAPGMMRKLPQFIHRLFAILMKLLLDIEDETAWHTANSEDEDAGETSNYSVAQECLDRLSISLGGNTIVPVASEMLPAYLADPEWQKHHAALICLAQIAEGCAKVMVKNLEQVVSMVLNSFNDPHPRVRWAAINAIGQLSTDLGPDLQTQYHQRVLPALAAAMDDFQNPRVQAHAASAVLNFSENCTPEILTPYMDGIVSKLLVLLQNGKQMVQEGALTALASVADSSQELFQKYYDAVMPYLKTILVNATDKSNRMLRAKSMECISLVGMAVGKEKFRDDAKQVMEVLMQLQGAQLESDDPTSSYMLQAWARLCKCLGQDFLPYMSVVMPPLLQSAQLKPDVTITSADSDADIDESDDESIETITLGDKRIGIKTSVLEEKATACNMLCCYADELKEGFFPWIDQVAPTLVPLLKFYFHEEVRKAAVSAMPELLRSAKLAVGKGVAQGRNEAYVKQLSDYIIPALVEALHKEPEIEICSNMLEALNECVQISGPLLAENQVRCIVDEIKQVITASSSRKAERAERTKAEDFDAGILERPSLSANHMGTVAGQDINGGLMKKLKKKKNKESIFSTEEVDNVQVGSRDSKKPKAKLLYNVNASDTVGDFNSDSNTGKTPEKEMIVVNGSKIGATHQENDKKRKRKKAKSKVRDEEGTSSVLEAPKEATNDREKDTVSKSEGEVACDFEKGGEQAREEGQAKEKRKKKRKNNDIQSIDGNCNGLPDGGDLLEIQANSEVIEKGEAVEDKKKRKKKSKEEKKEKRKNDDTGCSSEMDGVGSLEIQTNSEVIDKLESVEGKKKKKKKRKGCDDSGSSVICKRNESAGVHVNGEDQKGKKKKKKKKKGKDIVNCDTNITNEAVEPCDQSVSHKKMKKVTFSDQNEVFPVPESSSKRKRRKTVDDDDESGDALIRGKRFSKEEDEILEKAVLDYIEEHQLGENGVEMVMKCKSYPELKDCWKEIRKALPHRPTESVYYRAHILFERGEVRKWTQQEFDDVRKFYEKHGAQWKKLAEDMGKHRFHVKDAWRRIKLPNLKRGDWSQGEYQQLFDLVNLDLSMKVFQEKKTKHGMLRDNIGWETISEKLTTRSNAMCCMKWYGQLSSPLVAQGEWADTDDYRLLIALTELDAACEEDVDWDNLLEHRSGDVCRERWNQMVRHIGYHGIKPFMEQVEVLSRRYCPEILEAREEYESRPPVD